MQPFIHFPIGIVNQEKEQKEVIARILPDQIDYYYPGFHSGTVIVNKSGNSFLTSLTIDDVDTLLINYDQQRNSKGWKGKFGILKVEYTKK